jgi:hypothetical protein
MPGHINRPLPFQDGATLSKLELATAIVGQARFVSAAVFTSYPHLYY